MGAGGQGWPNFGAVTGKGAHWCRHFTRSRNSRCVHLTPRRNSQGPGASTRSECGWRALCSTHFKGWVRQKAEGKKTKNVCCAGIDKRPAKLRGCPCLHRAKGAQGKKGDATMAESFVANLKSLKPPPPANVPDGAVANTPGERHKSKAGTRAKCKSRQLGGRRAHKCQR